MKPGNFTMPSNRIGVISPMFVIIGFFWNDIINYSIPTFTGSSVMVVDLIFFYSLFCLAIEAFRIKKYRNFLIFPAVILCYMLIGLLGSGVKALSDSRQYYHFFFLFLGFRYAQKAKDTPFITVLYRVIFSLALGAFALFLIEVIIGHGFGLAILSSEETAYGYLEDGRGMRILGSTETFNLCLFVLFVFIFKKEIKSKISKVVSFLFFIAVLITQNRTPIIAMCIGLFFLNITYFQFTNRKIYRLLLNVFFLAFVFLIIYLLDSYKIFPLLSSLKSAVSIENDEIGTSSFRLLGVLGAMEIFFKNVLFGEGLGKGWQIDFGFSILNIAPHNQYASILAKFGLAGFGAFLIWMIKCFSVIKRIPDSLDLNRDIIRFSLVLFISQIPYGFGFDFHPFFPFYMGMLLPQFVKKNSYEQGPTGNSGI